MEIFQLVYAAALAKYCSFSIAAEKLFISQPSLSLQIQKLEQELGFSIFFRNKRGVRLTYAGEQFIRDADKVIKEYNSLKNKYNANKKMFKRKVALGTSTMSSVLIAGSIKRFLNAFPLVDFSLVEASDYDLIEKVRSSEINLAFVMMPQDHAFIDELSVVPIQECCICAVMMNDHKLARREFIELKDLEHEEMVFSSAGSVIRPSLFYDFFETFSQRNSVIDINNIEAKIMLIRDGAISFSPSVRTLWNSEPAIVLVPIKPSIDVLYALIYSRSQEMTFIENSMVEIICVDYESKNS